MTGLGGQDQNNYLTGQKDITSAVPVVNQPLPVAQPVTKTLAPTPIPNVSDPNGATQRVVRRPNTIINDAEDKLGG